ncbi:MAG: PA14 domain-containing protein [Planctomycetes bacterium]|nr:PA14 domain-containing protein [Planctomycetota bacterium]
MSIFESTRVFLASSFVPCMCAVVLAGEPASVRGKPNATEKPAKAVDRGERPPARGPWRIDRSLAVAKGSWSLGVDAEDAALVIDGARGIVLDLGAAEFVGSTSLADPSTLAGVGLVVRNAEDVVIRGGKFGGWRTGVRIEASRGVRLENVVVTDLYAPRLGSSAALEAASDVLDRRDFGLVARGGAGFVVERSHGVEFVECAVRRGVVGIAAIEAPGVSVRGGRFGYLSAYGLAFWRSAEVSVADVQVEQAVRGGRSSFWSGAHGSAGLLLVDSATARVERSSFTRCGSGAVVLGASPQATLVACDVSAALAHGVECTEVVEPRILELVARDVGGDAVVLSEATRAWVVECVLERARGKGVSVQAGGEHVLARNWVSAAAVGLATNGVTGLALVANGFEQNGLDWELERSRGVSAAENVFENGLVLRIDGTGDGALERERIRGVGGALPSGRLVGTEVLAHDAERASAFESELAATPRASRRPATPPASPAAPRAPAAPGAPATPGAPAAHGAATGEPSKTPSPQSSAGGSSPAEDFVFDRFGPWDPEGPRPAPAPRAAGGLFAAAQWEAVWFAWDDAHDPRGLDTARSAWRELAREPLLSRTVGAFRTPFGAGARPSELPSERFGLLARTTLELAAGRYRVQSTSDDGVSLRVDGKPVLENWSWHATTVDRAEFEVGAGAHVFELEYFQVDGSSALALELDALGSNSP